MKRIIDIIINCQSKGVKLFMDDSGEGLKMKGAIKNLSEAEKEELKAHKDAIIQFLRSVTDTGRQIEVLDSQPDYALSAAQRRLWILSQADSSNVAYNMTAVYEFRGNVKVPALEQAFSKVIARHEILRTVFIEQVSGEVRQVVRPAEAFVFTIPVDDVRNREDKGDYVGRQVKAAQFSPFNLRSDLLLRVALFRVDEDHWIFSYVMHHIISDGWSMGILIREVISCYNALVKEEEDILPSLRIQYKDYAVWQKNLPEATRTADLHYWKTQFEGTLPILELPGDHARPLIKTFNGGTAQFRLSSAQRDALNTLCQKEGATLFMGLLALVNVLLYHYTGQEDIIIGCPTAGRDHVELENQIGFYVNTLALRNKFSKNSSFLDVLQVCKVNTLGAHEHPHLPFDELVDALDLQGDPSRNPLFDVWIVLHNTHLGIDIGQQGQHDFEVSEYNGQQQAISRYDLSFSFTEDLEGILVQVGYNSDIYAGQRIKALGGHLVQLLQSILDNPQEQVVMLPLLRREEEQELLLKFNIVPAAVAPVKTIVTLFEEQVTATPEATAVVYGDHALTYSQLNDQANRLAHYLRKHYAVKADDLVGIRLERTELMIVAVIGILKSGGAYLPVDPEYPQERVSFMMEDSGCKVLLDEALLAGISADTTYTGGNLPEISGEFNLAYVIYTSGSTGNPKGVMIEHRALTDYHTGLLKATNIRSCSSFGHFSTIAADLGNTIIYTALLIGAAVHIFPTSGIVDPGIQLDCIKIVPSHWKSLQTDVSAFVPVKTLIFGGEQLTADVITQALLQRPGLTIYNHYGPTEATIGKLVCCVSDMPDDTVALGRPFGNNRVYILNEQQQLRPKGVNGEICIAGTGLARGYLNRQELDAEKFIADPFYKGERMYRTGDTGRWLEDGRILFAGRQDTQVKIRGFRVEPGEIEHALRQLPAIDTALVIVSEDQAGDKHILAYLKGKATIDIAAVRQELSETLPAYMIPGYFIPIETIPLTPNGKVDRKLLPVPEALYEGRGTTYTAPGTEVEKTLVDIWSDALGIEPGKVGIHDNFFNLGGHSLKAIRIMLRIHESFKVKLDMSLFFEDLTITALAAEIENELWARSAINDQAANDKSIII